MLEFSAPAVTSLDSRGGACAYAQMEELRAMGPAVPVELPEGVRAWSVTRGDVVKTLLTHPGVSRNLKANVPTYVPGSVPWLSPWVDVDSMATAEGREHSRLRKLITPALSPRRTDALRPQIEALVGRLLDDLAKLPDDPPVDLHSAFSYRVPTEVICDLFGLPDDQRAHVLHLFRRVGATDVPEEESVAVYSALVESMHHLIETRRRDPGDDLTSFLLSAHADGEKDLSEHELVSTLLLMIGGGSTTTINLIDHTVRELLTRPDQLALLRAQPERWDDAIEESLRVHCPVMHLPMRWAVERIELEHGVIIEPGDAILICYAAHGRDAAVHEQAAEFDIARPDKEHIAFGLGAHFCPGSRLAKLEALVALPLLFDRFPGLTLAVDPQEIRPHHTFIGNTLEELPVHLHSR